MKLALFFSLVLFATPAPQDPGRAQTLEQVRPILIDELQQLRAVQQKYNAGDQNRRANLRMARELRDIQSSTDDKLGKILSKKQIDEMKKIREELRQERRERARSQPN